MRFVSANHFLSKTTWHPRAWWLRHTFRIVKHILFCMWPFSRFFEASPRHCSPHLLQSARGSARCWGCPGVIFGWRECVSIALVSPATAWPSASLRPETTHACSTIATGAVSGTGSRSVPAAVSGGSVGASTGPGTATGTTTARSIAADVRRITAAAPHLSLQLVLAQAPVLLAPATGPWHSCSHWHRC